jgi:prevent-host-death family protein
MTKSALRRVGVHEAKTHLSSLLRAVDAGEEIEIVRNGEPIARLVPAGPRRVRAFGADRGLVTIADDFDAPLPDEVAAAFES